MCYDDLKFLLDWLTHLGQVHHYQTAADYPQTTDRQIVTHVLGKIAAKWAKHLLATFELDHVHNLAL